MTRVLRGNNMIKMDHRYYNCYSCCSLLVVVMMTIASYCPPAAVQSFSPVAVELQKQKKMTSPQLPQPSPIPHAFLATATITTTITTSRFMHLSLSSSSNEEEEEADDDNDDDSDEEEEEETTAAAEVGEPEDEEQDDDDDDDDDISYEYEYQPHELPQGPPWKLPNDFETFLNQCSIQSFVFLLRNMRDPQTVLWVENFTEPSIRLKSLPNFAPPSAGFDPMSDRSKLLRYHGLVAINSTVFPTWDTYFEKMLEQPAETYRIVTEAKHIPDYDLDINPASLCSRIISVREQIGREFERDLGVIASMGGNTLESYWDAIKEQRDRSEQDINFPRGNLLFLEFSPDYDDDYAPSPLRKGNFDLLCLLATQEAIHRVLNDPERQKVGAVTAEKASNMFLTSFYTNRIMSHFTGPQRYGRSDDILEELLSETPRTISISENKDDVDVVTCLIDPTRIAELVLNERERVAFEWQSVCREIPQNHMQIKQMQLNLLMGKPSASSDSTSSSESVWE